MAKIQMQISYDGTNYSGWQVQANTPHTIQEKVEGVLGKFHRRPTRIYGASRTDAGVHARGQMAHFYLEVPIPLERIPQAFNGELPDDIVCLQARQCPEDFHVRHDALAKKYIYRINNKPYPDVFTRNFCYHYHEKLKVKAMQQAARYLEGKKDFSAFQARGCSNATTVKSIYHSRITLQDNGEIWLEIVGSGFLYKMMRIIAGTLINAGKGKISPDDIPGIIASRDRTQAGFTAPAKGLTLEKIYYDQEILTKEVIE